MPTDHGERFAAGHRIPRPERAGGPLLGLGTCPLSFAIWILGAPTGVQSLGQPHPAGVNCQLAAVLRDADGNQAVVHTTLFSDTPTATTVAATQATLPLPGPFYRRATSSSPRPAAAHR